MKSRLTSVFLTGLFACAVHAGSITVTNTPPVVDQSDIAQLTGETGSDSIWTDRPNIGQTFTTDKKGGILKSWTLKVSGAAPATKTYNIRVGEVSGSSFNTITQENLTLTVDLAVNDYITYVLEQPLELLPLTTYGVDEQLTGSSQGYQSGIPGIRRVDSDVYSGGSRYIHADGDPATISPQSGTDRIFHIDIDTPPPGGTILVIK